MVTTLKQPTRPPANAIRDPGTSAARECRETDRLPHPLAKPRTRTRISAASVSALSESEIDQVVSFLRHIERTCQLDRSRNLDSSGDREGYRYLARQFLTLNFPAEWQEADLTRALRNYCCGLAPSWALILSTRDRHGHYRYRNRLMRGLKDAIKWRHQQEHLRWLQTPEGRFTNIVSQRLPISQWGDEPYQVLGRLAWQLFPQQPGLAFRVDGNEEILVQFTVLNEGSLQLLKAHWLECLERKDRVAITDWEEQWRRLPLWIPNWKATV
jgi:hypothetical protein